MPLLDQDSESNDDAAARRRHRDQAAALAVERARPRAAASGSGQQGGKQKRGQEPLRKDNEKAKRFIDVTKDKTRMAGKQVHSMLDDGNTYVHCHTDKNVYVGGESGKGTFDFLATLSGPCINSKGKIG